MPPRATWRGQLRISLVTVPVRLYSATESTQTIHLNRLHKGCGQRVRNQLKCPTHGELDQSDLVHGYEYEKDRYAVIEKEELDQIKLPTDKVIDVHQFARAEELDPRHLDRPYYLAPDGPVAERGFTMIRQAMEHEGVVAIGKVVLSSREQVVCLRPQARGFVVLTLRLANEVRSPEAYFEAIRDGEEIDSRQMRLAEQLIENMLAPLDLGQYEDRYQAKLRELIEAKVKGEQTVMAPDEEEVPAIDIMEALRRSVGEATERKRPGEAAGHRRHRRQPSRGRSKR